VHAIYGQRERYYARALARVMLLLKMRRYEAAMIAVDVATCARSKMMLRRYFSRRHYHIRRRQIFFFSAADVTIAVDA